MWVNSSKTVITVSLTLMLITGGGAHARETGRIVAVSPIVGDVIDRGERDTYGLFQAIPDFQSALFFVMPDGTYEIQISYLDHTVEKTQTWKVSEQEFLLNYRRRVERLGSRPGPLRQRLIGPMIQIETQNGGRLRGPLQAVSDDSIVMHCTDGSGQITRNARREAVKVSFVEVTSLSLPRKSPFLKSVAWGLLPSAIGAFLGLASGDDPPGWFSMTAEQKAGALGLFLGGIGVSIGGTIGALKGVDIDVPWEEKSLHERKRILTQLGCGQYRSRHVLRVSPWVGGISPPGGDMALAIGGRLRFHLTPRSGFEFMYGRRGWSSIHDQEGSSFSSRTEQSRTEYLLGGFFISLSRGCGVNPFVAWGWGRVSTTVNTRGRYEDSWDPGVYEEWSRTHTESCVSMHFFGGVEIPLAHWFRLEGRMGNILDLGEGDHFSILLGLTIGPDV